MHLHMPVTAIKGAMYQLRSEMLELIQTTAHIACALLWMFCVSSNVYRAGWKMYLRSNYRHQMARRVITPPKPMGDATSREATTAARTRRGARKTKGCVVTEIESVMATDDTPAEIQAPPAAVEALTLVPEHATPAAEVASVPSPAAVEASTLTPMHATPVNEVASVPYKPAKREKKVKAVSSPSKHDEGPPRPTKEEREVTTCDVKDAYVQPSGDGATCVICMDARRSVLLPCKHVCTCSACARALVVNGAPCPICRVAFRRFTEIFLV